MPDQPQTELMRTSSDKSLENIPGYNNSRFSEMVEELTNQYKIPQYSGASTGLYNSSKFEVIKPSLINNKYVAYYVKGEDALGVFEGTRRYNEFFTLRSTLKMRWPGVFIPSIPPKKAVGNKDVKFIIERRYFLERFV